jgi:hypothetical protein
LTDNLGRYLGVPLIQDRISLNTYRGIIDKVQAKLSSWKSQVLSLPGRLTLIHAVTSAIPIYTMQTAKLPVNVCNQLDKINRNFLWGNNTTQTRVHLVNWDQVCRPKKNGGLGIKKTSHMNQALLAKASWRILNRDHGLWADLMKKKYLNGDSCIHMLDKKNASASSTWKSIIFGAETLKLGVFWRLGDGKNVKFWFDKWIGNNSLADLGHAPPLHIDHSETVADFLIANHWNTVKLQSCLPLEAIQRIINIPIGIDSGIPDRCIWGLSPNGNFSVKTAYELCCG